LIILFFFKVYTKIIKLVDNISGLYCIFFHNFFLKTIFNQIIWNLRDGIHWTFSLFKIDTNWNNVWRIILKFDSSIFIVEWIHSHWNFFSMTYSSFILIIFKIIESNLTCGSNKRIFLSEQWHVQLLNISRHSLLILLFVLI
jgi:hypothetical protein